jgi:hypothetical protein
MPEGEVAELGEIEPAMLDQLIGFFDHSFHADHVPMADVGGEHGLELAAAGHQAAVEGGRHLCGSSASQPK